MKHLHAQKNKHRVFFWVLLLVFGTFYLGIGALGGFYLGLRSDLPDVKTLESYNPNLITEIYSDDNKVIGEFAIERRRIVSSKAIPSRLRQAILSVEDKNFFNHQGVDLGGIVRAAYKNWRAGRLVAGGSTLTQQLTRQLFLSSEKSLDRKIREFILAQQIEHNFSKEEIFALYCNVIYMGHSAYGFAAATDYYFGKSLEDLNLEECALLAALPKAPTKYSPYFNAQRALRRRNYVLARMAAEGYISKEEEQEAAKRPLALKKQEKIEIIAPHFLEMVRQYLAKRYTTKEIWGGGLRIYTTLNVEMQKAANKAVTGGLMQYERRHGWRGPVINVLADSAHDLDSFTHEDWKSEPQPGTARLGIVSSFDENGNARIKLGECLAHLKPEDIAWTGKGSPKQILQIGDLAVFKIHEFDEDENMCAVTLEQTPQVQGALIAIDNKTGEIKALVGGYDYTTSEFNRATRALRQPGSAFKPFVYAAALEAGVKTDDRILDVSIRFRGPNGTFWEPHNYDRKYKGSMTLKQAMAESRNAATVRLASRLGVRKIIEIAERFGITTPMDPYLPISLGAADVTLMELASAYSAFANEGIRFQPYFIRRIETFTRSVKEKASPEKQYAVDSYTAEEMVSLLRGVVNSGTATKAKVLGEPVGGKTGTTNSFTDAWFVGFNLPGLRDQGRSHPAKDSVKARTPKDLVVPSLTAGVWVGFDDKRSLGEKETGGRAALPIWIDFMKGIYQQTTDE